MERHLVVPDSWNSLDFSTEQVLVQTCAVLGVVELDLASSQDTVKTSVMSTTTTSTHWVLKPCLEFRKANKIQERHPFHKESRHSSLGRCPR